MRNVKWEHPNRHFQYQRSEIEVHVKTFDPAAPYYRYALDTDCEPFNSHLFSMTIRACNMSKLAKPTVKDQSVGFVQKYGKLHFPSRSKQNRQHNTQMQNHHFFKTGFDSRPCHTNIIQIGLQGTSYVSNTNNDACQLRGLNQAWYSEKKGNMLLQTTASMCPAQKWIRLSYWWICILYPVFGGSVLLHRRSDLQSRVFAVVQCCQNCTPTKKWFSQMSSTKKQLEPAKVLRAELSQIPVLP